jgi:hypothetical protein
MSETAQLVLAGTVWFGSLSSTFMLQLIVNPYVFDMVELPVNATRNDDRQFLVRKIGIAGNLKKTQFRFAEAEKSSVHPFASFRIHKQGYFYIFGKSLQDPALRERLCRD